MLTFILHTSFSFFVFPPLLLGEISSMCLHRKEQIEVALLTSAKLVLSSLCWVCTLRTACVYFHMLTDLCWPAGPGEGRVEGYRQGNETFLTSWCKCVCVVSGLSKVTYYAKSKCSSVLLTKCAPSSFRKKDSFSFCPDPSIKKRKLSDQILANLWCHNLFLGCVTISQ